MKRSRYCWLLLTACWLLAGAGLAQEPARPKILPPPPLTSLSYLETFKLWNECAPIGLVVEELPDDAADIELSRRNASRRWQKAACGSHGCTTRRCPSTSPSYTFVSVCLSPKTDAAARLASTCHSTNTYMMTYRIGTGTRRRGRPPITERTVGTQTTSCKLVSEQDRSVHLGISARERDRLPVMASA